MPQANDESSRKCILINLPTEKNTAVVQVHESKTPNLRGTNSKTNPEKLDRFAHLFVVDSCRLGNRRVEHPKPENSVMQQSHFTSRPRVMVLVAWAGDKVSGTPVQRNYLKNLLPSCYVICSHESYNLQ